MIARLRLLLLEELGVLGWADNPDRFHLHWEFFDQLLVLAGLALITDVTDAEAWELADLIESKADERGWRLHVRGVWGDEDGKRLAGMIEFLRGGGFFVVARVSELETKNPGSKTLWLGFPPLALSA